MAKETVTPPKAGAGKVFDKTPINVMDTAAEAVALSDLMQWVESARAYCAGVIDLAHQDEDVRKAIKDHLGYVYPRSWEHAHEGNGLDFLMQHQRDLLASIASSNENEAAKEVQHG